MNLRSLFSIRRYIDQIPDHKLSRSLFAVYSISLLALPLVIISLEWGDDGIMGMTFKNSGHPLAGWERINLLVQSAGIWLLLLAITLVVILFVCFLSSKLLAAFKIKLGHWKIFNTYLYAKTWQQIVGLFLSLILLAVSAAASARQIDVSAAWANRIASLSLLLPALVFYSIFIYGLVRSVSKKQ